MLIFAIERPKRASDNAGVSEITTRLGALLFDTESIALDFRHTNNEKKQKKSKEKKKALFFQVKK